MNVSKPDDGDSLSLREHLSSLLPRLNADEWNMPEWPPDVFALAASTLLHGGTYASAMDIWPPVGRERTWAIDARNAGTIWRETWGTTFFGLDTAWQTVRAHLGTHLNEVKSCPHLVHALIELMAVSDESCINVGIAGFQAPDGTPEDEFYIAAGYTLRTTSEHAATLCREIHPSRAKVLPKMHTPQSGLTIRSYSLNLALIVGSEIEPKWHVVPTSLTKDDDPLRLLIIPWPLQVDCADFRPATPLSHEATNMPSSEFGFFEYAPSSQPNAVKKILSILDDLEKQSIEYDMVVLPELALSPDEFDLLNDRIVSRDAKFFLSGVRVKAGSSTHCGNQVKFGIPLLDPLTQAKHHRWQLERNQIEQYGLCNLGKEQKWWEHISLKDREFMFVSLNKGLVISVLICEDLARPDPVGDLVRAVGPNIVVALLMDGPQISGRWPGRYAASLAEDPGSSVLSVTSFGMSALSKPQKRSVDRRRVVALWQHPGIYPNVSASKKELELPRGYKALLLTIQKTYGKEWSADGRNDDQSAAIWHLSECEPVPRLTTWSKIKSWFG
jgi:hypothetical protein